MNDENLERFRPEDHELFEAHYFEDFKVGQQSGIIKVCKVF